MAKEQLNSEHVPATTSIYSSCRMFDRSLLLMEPKDDYDHPVPGIFYSPENVPGRGCNEQDFQDDLAGCTCSDGCNSTRCQCLVLSRGPNYDGGGRLLQLLAAGDDQQQQDTAVPIMECHQGCSCSSSNSCYNRVVQRGPRPDLALRGAGEGPEKGLGLFSSSPVPRGSFVCCYAGEVIGEAEAKARLKRQDEKGEDNYILFVHERSESRLLSTTVVDPTVLGNVGRYLNHSCGPNLSVHPVRSSRRVPHLALFARRDIRAGEELTFSYGDAGGAGGPEENKSSKKCLCGAEGCKGFLPASSSLQFG